MGALTWSDQCGSGQSHPKQMSSSYKCTKRQLENHKIRKIGFSGKTAEKAAELQQVQPREEHFLLEIVLLICHNTGGLESKSSQKINVTWF